MITIESIEKKLGFNPLTHRYVNLDFPGEDDSIDNPLVGLSDEELDYIISIAENDPRCWIEAE